MTKLLSSFNLEWSFRGQISDWELQPTLERNVEVKARWDYEFRSLGYLKEISRRNSLFESDEYSLVNLLSLFQHYGGYTRLLDFTRSQYVAVFFSLAKAHTISKPKPVIWAINTRQLAFQANQHRSDFKLEDYFEEESQEKKVLVIDGDRSHERHSIQQSVYLAPSNPKNNFVDCLNNSLDSNNHIYKIILNDTVLKQGFVELMKMNISYKTLFPGIQGELNDVTFRYLTDWAKITNL